MAAAPQPELSTGLLDQLCAAMPSDVHNSLTLCPLVYFVDGDPVMKAE